MDMGERIKKARIKRGMTQTDLGNALGLSKAAISRWERGFTANLKRDTLKRLAVVLDTSPTELILDDDANTFRTDMELSAEQVEFLSLFDGGTDFAKEIVLDILRKYQV